MLSFDTQEDTLESGTIICVITNFINIVVSCMKMTYYNYNYIYYSGLYNLLNSICILVIFAYFNSSYRSVYRWIVRPNYLYKLFSIITICSIIESFVSAYWCYNDRPVNTGIKFCNIVVISYIIPTVFHVIGVSAIVVARNDYLKSLRYGMLG